MKLLNSYIFIFLINISTISVVKAENLNLPKEIFKTNNFFHDLVSKSTVAIINNNKIKLAGNEFEIISKTLADDRMRPMCSDEMYANQIAAVHCTGFLVAPDLILTAGHCLKSKFMSFDEMCKSFTYVFEFKATEDASDLEFIEEIDEEYDYYDRKVKTYVPSKNVFHCKKVVEKTYFAFASEYSYKNAWQDYALIKLTKKVNDRVYLEINKSSKIKMGTKVFILGHPEGLQQKVSDDGKVILGRNFQYSGSPQLNNYENIFSTNLRTFGGYSGAPIVDATTGVVLGIHNRNNIDNYLDSHSCRKRSKIDKSEIHTKETKIHKLDKVLKYLNL